MSIHDAYMDGDYCNYSNKFKMLNIYLAARYSRNAEMRLYRDEIINIGHKVISRWIDQHGGNLLESFVAEKLNSDPAYCSKFANIDIQDMQNADIIISFTSKDGGGKGGRHFEFGWSIGMKKLNVIVGPREHIFHTLPEIQHFTNWDDCKKWLANPNLK